MIVKSNARWFRVFLSLKGSSLRETWPRILSVTVLSIFVTIYEFSIGVEVLSLTVFPFTLVSVALGIFLGFYNNAAYDKFWEGRIPWGRMVNVSRTLASRFLTLAGTRSANQIESIESSSHPSIDEFRRQSVFSIIAYVHALRHHLRETDSFASTRHFLGDSEVRGLDDQKNVPIAILHRIRQRVGFAWDRGWIDTCHVAVFEQSI